MAKKMVNWTLDGSILKISKQMENKPPEGGLAQIDAEFDLAALLKVMFIQDWDLLPDAGRQGFAFLVKQKLMDTGASAIADYPGKVSAARARWTDLIALKWTSDRVNATGAAERKADAKIGKDLKEVSKAITLDGLRTKRLLAKFEGQPVFTPEDETRLQELELAAAEVLLREFKRGKK